MTPYIEERLTKLEAKIKELEERIVDLEEGERELPDLLTTSQAAAMLNVHFNTIKNWIEEGKLPAFKVGRGWRIRREDVERLIPSQEG